MNKLPVKYKKKPLNCFSYNWLLHKNRAECHFGENQNLVIAFNYCRHLSQNPCYILFSSQAFKFVKVTQKNIPLIKLLSNSLFLFLRQSNVTHLKFHFTKKWNCQIRETLKPPSSCVILFEMKTKNKFSIWVILYSNFLFPLPWSQEWHHLQNERTPSFV